MEGFAFFDMGSTRYVLELNLKQLSLTVTCVGTGKTTVIVQVLLDIIKSYHPEPPKILMTASTHNGEIRDKTRPQ